MLGGGAPVKRFVIVYCRVSCAGQKRRSCFAGVCHARPTAWLLALPLMSGSLKLAGGVNFKRKSFLKILDRMQHGEVSKILVAHKDRLMRFGFDLFEHIAQEAGCEIVVVNQESLSPQQEMVEDLMSIVHTFSCRLYGMRKYKSQIRLDFPEHKLANPKEPLQ
jgi:predicted site-specific integrase-resolvase